MSGGTVKKSTYSTIDTKLYEHFKNIYYIANFIAYFYFFESKIENFIGKKKKDDNIYIFAQNINCGYTL